jgi:hypothetical protein
MNNDMGYISLREVIPPIVIRQFKLWAMNPDNIHRGNAVNGTYYGKHRKGREYNVWWSKSPPEEMWRPVIDILRTHIDAIFIGTKWDMHVVDTITTRPGSSKIRAHIDIPYRFEEYAYAPGDETLGVQIIVPLDIFTLQNGATAFLPGSHASKFYYKDIEENQEEYDTLLTTEGMQFLSHPGDVLIYNSRTLHSTMPNKSNFYRSALLLNAVATSIIPTIKLIDKNTDHKKT